MNILPPILNNLQNVSILVIGDVMLDTFQYGSVERISPEAPIPILKLERKKEMLGGAGNVVTNLRSLGVETFVVGAIGKDENAVRVRSILNDQQVGCHLIENDGIPTISKTRFVSGNQQILRTDVEKIVRLTQEQEDELIRQVTSRINEFDVVILSDYKKGIITKRVCEQVIEVANSQQIPVFVDPKGNDFSLYRGATLIKPNQKELCEVFAGENVIGNETVFARKLIEKFDFIYCLVTLGKDGMLLVGRDGEQHFHSVRREVFDVSGAGDTVIATLAGCYGAGGTIEESCIVSNIAGGIVVGKAGTSFVTPFEIEREISINNKVFSLEDLRVQVDLWRKAGCKIGFTNGCFDIIHAGHVQTLSFARRNCDKLVVALNSDSSITKLKGPERPINGQEERAAVLSELESVDALIFFAEDTPLQLIMAVKPDVLIKGGDYKAENVVGYDFVTSYGGKVLLASVVNGLSTTNLVSKIRAL